MNCKEIDKYIVDYIDGTITSMEMEVIKTHISGCNACKQLHYATKKLWNSLETIPVLQPSSQLKSSFEKILEEERQLQSKLIALKPQNMTKWKTILQVAAIFVFFIFGYFSGSYNSNKSSEKKMLGLQDNSSLMKENMILAMLDNRSPSKRIAAVSYSEEITKPNPEILYALIERLQYDSNINVRLSAAEALSRFTDSEIVITSLMAVLTSENNPIIQIEIIQILADFQEKRAIAPIRELLERPETPTYVKNLANIGIAKLLSTT